MFTFALDAVSKVGLVFGFGISIWWVVRQIVRYKRGVEHGIGKVGSKRTGQGS